VDWVLAPAADHAEVRGRLAVRGLFTYLPNVTARFKTHALECELKVQLESEWDAIVVDHLGMGWAWPWLEAYRRRNPAVIAVFIAHQCEGHVRRGVAQSFRGNPLRKFGLHVDALKADRLEREIVRKSTLFTSITAEDRDHFGNLAKSVLLSPGYAGLRQSSREITAKTPRRAIIFGSALWLAKQMNLEEFIAIADELFWRQQIELWVVGKVPERFRVESHHSATRFLGFVDNPLPIFGSVRIGIVAERTGGGFKLKSLDYIFNRVPIAALKNSIAGLPLTPELDYLSFGSFRELAQGIAAAIDDVDKLNMLQKAAYAKCTAAFDWSERGHLLHKAMQEAVRRQCATTASILPRDLG